MCCFWYCHLTAETIRRLLFARNLFGNKTKTLDNQQITKRLKYPEPVLYLYNKVHTKETKYQIIKVAKIGILTLCFIKKTMFCYFWLPFGYPKTKNTIFATKGN